METMGVEAVSGGVINSRFYMFSLSIKSQCDTPDKQAFSYPDAWLMMRDLFKKNTNGLMRFGTFVIESLLIALGLFMFQDGSDAIVADLFNLW